MAVDIEASGIDIEPSGVGLGNPGVDFEVPPARLGPPLQPLVVNREVVLLHPVVILINSH